MVAKCMVSSADRHKLPLEIELPDKASQGLQNAKNFLAETTSKAISTVSETTNQAAGTVTQTADKAGSWSQSTGNAANPITQAARQAVDTVATTIEESANLSTATERAASVVNQATDQAVDTATVTAKQATHSLVEAIAGTSHALEDTIQTAERLNVAAAESVQGAMNSFVREWVDSIRVWIDSHPAAFWAVQTMLWAIDHPIRALGVLLLLVFIIQRLLKALSYLVERALVFLLQAPFKFGRFLLQASAGFLGRLRGKEAASELEALSFELTQNTQKERLATILTRLEVIRQEQNQLLQEVAVIVASDELESGDINSSAQSNQRPRALRLLFPNRSKDMKPVPNHNDAALG